MWGSHFFEFHSLVEPILGKSLPGPWTHATSGVEHSSYVLFGYCKQIDVLAAQGVSSNRWRGMSVANSSFLPIVWPYHTKRLLCRYWLSTSVKPSVPALASAPLIGGHRDGRFQVLDRSPVAECAVPVFRRQRQEDCCYFEASSV